MGSSQSKNSSISGIVWNASNKNITYALTQQRIKHKRILYEGQVQGRIKNMQINLSGNNKLNQQYFYQDLKTYVIVKPGQVTNIGLQNIKMPAYISCWIGDQKQVKQLFFQNVVVKQTNDICIKITKEQRFRPMRDYEIENARKITKLDQFFNTPSIEEQLIATQEKYQQSIRELQRMRKIISIFVFPSTLEYLTRIRR